MLFVVKNCGRDLRVFILYFSFNRVVLCMIVLYYIVEFVFYLVRFLYFVEKIDLVNYA